MWLIEKGVLDIGQDTRTLEKSTFSQTGACECKSSPSTSGGEGVLMSQRLGEVKGK